MEIKIKYLADIEKVKEISKGDWIDLRCAEDIVLKAGEFKMIPLGIAMELPKGYEAIVVPRSSTFKNYGIIQTNSIGVIDESYCGDSDEWKLPVYCLETRTFENGKPVTKINKGDRICQFRVFEHQPDIEFEQVEHLDNANRGGFGSTGV